MYVGVLKYGYSVNIHAHTPGTASEFWLFHGVERVSRWVAWVLRSGGGRFIVLCELASSACKT